MKKTCLTLFLFCLPIAFCFSQKKDFQIIVGLNIQDCINCYTNGLNKIDKEADSVDVILVMSEAVAPDSSAIIHKYNLRGITPYIVFSDSLFNLLTHGGRSVIALSSQYHNLFYLYDLEGLPDYMMDYLKRAGKPIDTLFPDYPNIALSVSILTGFFVHKNKVYFINKILDKVQGYNLFTGKRFLNFSIPDSILKQTFSYSGYPDSIYEKQHETLRKAHMAGYNIDNLVFNRDTLIVIFSNNYYKVEADTTLYSDNVNVIKVVNGKVVKTEHLPLYFKNPFDKSKTYFTSTLTSYYQNGDLYFHINASPRQNHHYILAGFKADSNGIFRLDDMHPKMNPRLYKYYNDCNIPFFHQGYFVFPLIDTLYPISPILPPIPLTFIPQKYKFKYPGKRCDHGIFIDDFYITKDYVWVAYANNDHHYETVIKHNRHTGTNLISNRAIKVRTFLYAHFDPLNPDYLLFTIPTKNKLLYRAKMF